ncbi:netrin-4 isoform X1 [Ictalurus punctatus]|uniref:Netrin-4 isoform X1 n=1 Tax=Ictalurus punctatus TaxID=7998 RepID=A0A2D0PIZ3_ICTPU|nr:netrin-4 isoform X1 [Ictalurus punctatus]
MTRFDRQRLRVAVLLLGFLHGVTASRCAGNACSPPVGNLASGRTLHTQSLCCSNSSLMADDPFLHPDTWWESGVTAAGEDEIHLDLEDRFCLTHVVMVFRSPRPAAMTLERSQDFGRTWETLKVFAENCSSAFGLPDDVSQQEALCTSRYSSAMPCTGGEVIFRSIAQGRGMDDPYSPEALSILTLTNLRVRLLKPHRCPASPFTSSRGQRNTPQQAPNIRFLPKVPRQPSRNSTSSDSAPYAILSLLAQGTCLCHGHAEQCLPTGGQNSLQSSGSVQVRGRCVCTHHTAGVHCEKCAPLYNDRPWRAANGSSGEPNPCQKCECHGHAQNCHFSQRVWSSTGGTSGGVCDDCQHNTEGRKCQRCRPGYRRHPGRPLASPQACTRCWCDPVGSVPVRNSGEAGWCHPRSGQCHCKPGVGGTICSHCLPGHWGFGLEGCRPCTCPLTCDPVTGHCLESKPNREFYNIPLGGKIPDLTHLHPHEENKSWSNELTVSALYDTGKCTCKERKVKSVSDLCRMKHSYGKIGRTQTHSGIIYVIKASVLSAHDKGTHAVVQVKVRKVLRSGVMLLSQGTHSLYPLSWTSRGCTCPVLNPGSEYLLAGSEETESGRLLVTMQSLVVPWTSTLSFLVSEALRRGCL